MCEIRLPIISIVPVLNRVEMLILGDKNVSGKVLIKLIRTGEERLANMALFEPLILPAGRITFGTLTALAPRCRCR